MGNLLRNERLKLFKKVSTWILLGLVIVWPAFYLSLDRWTFSDYTPPSWKNEYNDQWQTCQTELAKLPDDPFAPNAQERIDYQMKEERLRYQLEHDIDPLDWRVDLLTQMLQLKYYGTADNGTATDPSWESGKGTDEWSWMPEEPAAVTPAPVELSEETLAAIERYRVWIETDDWEAYVRQRLDDVRAGLLYGTWSADDRAVLEELLAFRLEWHIRPNAETSFNYGFSEVNRDHEWSDTLIDTLQRDRLALLHDTDFNGNVLSSARRAELEREIDVAERRLKEGLPPVEDDSFLGLLESTLPRLSVITILIIVLAGGIVATEFGNGTIKLLLITPHSRRSVFWAKALAISEIILMAAAGIFVLCFVCAGIFVGFDGLFDRQIITLFGLTMTVPYVVYLLFAYLLSLLPVIFYASVALMLSTVTRKSALAIAGTFLLMYGGELLMPILQLLILYRNWSLPFVKFLPFAATDLLLPTALVSPDVSTPIDPSVTLGFQVGLLAVYIACVLWIARDSFCRRDVK